MLPNPQGPSYNSSYCPTKMPLGQFFNNSAHSSGRFGLWVIYLFYYHLRKILKDFFKFENFKRYSLNLRLLYLVNVGIQGLKSLDLQISFHILMIKELNSKEVII